MFDVGIQLFHGSFHRHHPRFYYDDAVVSYGAGRSLLPVSDSVLALLTMIKSSF